MHWLDTIKDNIHLFLGGALSFWIYKEKVNGMTFCERFVYFCLSIAIGFYGGNALIELLDLNPASNRAYLLLILATIFGLAGLGLARDNLADAISELRKKWTS